MLQFFVIAVCAGVFLRFIEFFLGMAVLRALAKNGHSSARFRVTPILSGDAAGYIRERASFAVTVQRDFAAPPERVFQALLSEEFLAWLPTVAGVQYPEDEKGLGSSRAIVSTFLALREKITVFEPGRRLEAVVTGLSVPLCLVSGVEEYTLIPLANGRTRLVWSIAGTPRWIGWLPLRRAAPLARPVLRWVLGRARPLILNPPGLQQSLKP